MQTLASARWGFCRCMLGTQAHQSNKIRAHMTEVAAPPNVSEAMQGFSRWIDKLNDGERMLPTLVPFNIGNQTLGYLESGFSEVLLATERGVFRAEHDASGRACIGLDPSLADEAARTSAVAAVVAALAAAGRVTGIRGELYPVSAQFGGEPALLLERAAAPLFGIKAYGVHINGFVRRPDGLHLWVAKRSASKPTWPGRLDHIAAGGQRLYAAADSAIDAQPHGLSLKVNVAKECWEEAGIPEDIALNAQPCGAVSYTSWQGSGVKRDVLFVFDIELPESFVPQPQDGEVDDFVLWPIDKVLRTVACTEEYKDNCNLVLIDFFVRHGLISADAPGYLDLVRRLRSGDCS